MLEVMKDILIVVGMPVLRSVVGWAEKSLKDNKITKFEVKELTTTVMRVGAVGLVLYFGLDSLGFDIPALAAGAGAWIFDKVVSALKEKRSIK